MWWLQGYGKPSGNVRYFLTSQNWWHPGITGQRQNVLITWFSSHISANSNGWWFKKVHIINTHKDLYQCTRLPFGAPSIFSILCRGYYKESPMFSYTLMTFWSLANRMRNTSRSCEKFSQDWSMLDYDWSVKNTNLCCHQSIIWITIFQQLV